MYRTNGRRPLWRGSWHRRGSALVLVVIGLTAVLALPRPAGATTRWICVKDGEPEECTEPRTDCTQLTKRCNPGECGTDNPFEVQWRVVVEDEFGNVISDPVIVGTGLLLSMQHDPRPARDEV